MPKTSEYQRFQKPAKALALPAIEAVSNPYPGRDYEVHFEIPEFTCVCPKTGHPDFATLRIDYVPGKAIVELKSLKIYIEAYRSLGVFHEAVANRVLSDLVKAARPKLARLEADFNVRGGIHTVVATRYRWPSCSGHCQD